MNNFQPKKNATHTIWGSKRENQVIFIRNDL